MTALSPQPDMKLIEGGAPVFSSARRTVAEIQSARARVIELMKSAMVEGIHFGKIPGTPKPTLYKPGADMLLTMFRLGSRPLLMEDLSQHDEIRYRVSVEIFDIASGTRFEIGVGECSSGEAKYKWRKPVCQQEFDETPEDRRRVVWKLDDKKNAFQLRQVRTEPADIANTILKMAKKRGKVDGTIGATACGDVFGQDLEDLPGEWAQHLDADDKATIAEEPEQEPKPIKSADAPAHLHVVSVRVAKTGTNAKGGWTLYMVKFSDGVDAATFSESIATAAKALAASKAQVDREVEHDDEKNRDQIVLLKEKK